MAKSVLLLLGFLFIGHIVIGQVDISKFRKLNVTSPGLVAPVGGVKSDAGLISPKAFTQLIKQDIRFTVLGSQSPTPGFSLDISEKLSVKITGQIPSKLKIITLDVTAASNSDQDDIPVFSDGKFNGQISAGLNFHIIPSGTKKIRRDIILGNTYPYQTGADVFLKALKNIEDVKYKTPMLDTIAVLASYLWIASPTLLTQAFDVIATKPDDTPITCGVGAINVAFPGIKTTTVPALKAAMLGTRQHLFLELAPTYFPIVNDYSVSGVGGLIADLPGFTSWQADKLYAELVRLSKAYINNEQAMIDDEIRRSKPYWLRKQLNWFTVSIKPVFHTLTTFIDNPAAMKVDVGSTNFFEFELPLWYQFYDVRAKGGNLWRVGIKPVLGTNRETYTEATYVKTDTLKNYPGNYIIEQTQKTGVFDTGEPREAKLYANYYLEFYRLPRKNFVPGTVIKIAYTKNAVFGDDTERRLRLELGAVLNILNSDKTQSAFTLQPYAAITNLKDELDATTSRLKTFKEKLYIGIRIGLPIRGQLVPGE